MVCHRANGFRNFSPLDRIPLRVGGRMEDPGIRLVALRHLARYRTELPLVVA